MIVNKLSTRQPKVMTTKDLAKSRSRAKKTMTVKEIATAIGIAESTVRNKIAELFPGYVKNGVATRLNEQQVTFLKKNLTPRNLTLKSKVDNSVTHLEMLENVQRDLQWLISYNAELQSQNENLRISLDESKEWYSVKRMEKLNRGQTFDWRLLKKESERLGIEVKKVFDQNYGEVNAYHKDVWESIYFDTLDFEE